MPESKEMAVFLEGAWNVSVVDVESTLRHITKKVFKYIFEVAGTDTDSGEILHQVMAACRAHCLHNSIFSDAALIEEANLHLRAAGACRVKNTFFDREQFPFPTPITYSLNTQVSCAPSPRSSRPTRPFCRGRSCRDRDDCFAYGARPCGATRSCGTG